MVVPYPYALACRGEFKIYATVVKVFQTRYRSSRILNHNTDLEEKAKKQSDLLQEHLTFE